MWGGLHIAEHFQSFRCEHFCPWGISAKWQFFTPCAAKFSYFLLADWDGDEDNDSPAKQPSEINTSVKLRRLAFCLIWSSSLPTPTSATFFRITLPTCGFIYLFIPCSTFYEELSNTELFNDRVHALTSFKTQGVKVLRQSSKSKHRGGCRGIWGKSLLWVLLGKNNDNNNIKLFPN